MDILKAGTLYKLFSLQWSLLQLIMLDTIFHMILGIYVVYFYIGKELSKSFAAGVKSFTKLSGTQEGSLFDQQKGLH